MEHIRYNGIKISLSERIVGEYVFKKMILYAKIPVKSHRFWSWFYDAMSAIYDPLTPIFLPKYYRVIQLLVEENISRGARVLDLCCGTGNITLAAAKIALEVVGLDSSNRMLKKARKKTEKRNIDNVRFIYGDVAKGLDFDGESFDAITAGFSVPSNFYPVQGQNEKIVKEMYRVLKYNGKLALLEGLPEISNIYLSGEEYEELLTNAGFINLQMKIISDRYGIITAEKCRVSEK